MPLRARDLPRLGPGKYGDGDGLQFVVQKSGSRNWILRVTLKGRSREYGLGGFPTVGLQDARDAAYEMRKQIFEDGVLPDTGRQRRAAEAEIERSVERDELTFERLAEEVIALKEPSWRSPKTAPQWRQSLVAYAYPVIGTKTPREVTTDDILNILTPIWHTKSETARRVRERIEIVLNVAKMRGLMDGQNPAAWRGHLDLALPRRVAGHRTRHHPSLPWQEMPQFYAALCQREGVAPLALRLVALTGARSGEVRFATWGEVDGDAWSIPADRMKAQRPHRVPLSAEAVSVLDAAARMTGRRDPEAALIFPGVRKGRPLSDMSLSAVMRRMQLAAVPHGLRATLRSWCADHDVPHEVAEAILAHSQDRVVAAYQRSDYFTQRRAVLDDWAKYATSATSVAFVGLAK